MTNETEWPTQYFNFMKIRKNILVLISVSIFVRAIIFSTVYATQCLPLQAETYFCLFLHQPLERQPTWLSLPMQLWHLLVNFHRTSSWLGAKLFFACDFFAPSDTKKHRVHSLIVLVYLYVHMYRLDVCIDVWHVANVLQAENCAIGITLLTVQLKFNLPDYINS